MSCVCLVGARGGPVPTHTVPGSQRHPVASRCVHLAKGDEGGVGAQEIWGHPWPSRIPSWSQLNSRPPFSGCHMDHTLCYLKLFFLQTVPMMKVHSHPSSGGGGSTICSSLCGSYLYSPLPHEDLWTQIFLSGMATCISIRIQVGKPSPPYLFRSRNGFYYMGGVASWCWKGWRSRSVGITPTISASTHRGSCSLCPQQKGRRWEPPPALISLVQGNTAVRPLARSGPEIRTWRPLPGLPLDARSSGCLCLPASQQHEWVSSRQLHSCPESPLRGS